MTQTSEEAGDLAGEVATSPAASAAEVDDVFEEWERYPARVAEENAGYQRLAWFASALPDMAFSLLALAAMVDLLRRAARQIIRLWVGGMRGGGKA